MNKINILGFYLGLHDSNITFVKNGKVSYFKSERLTQLKHHRADMEWIKKICEQFNFHPDVVCFSDGGRNNIGSCGFGELFKESNDLFGAKTFCIDHHYAHILSAWMLEKATSSQYGICIDGRGDNNSRISIIKNPFHVRNSKNIMSSCDYQYCMFFQKLGEYMGLSGLSWDFAGKIMGLQAYGKKNSKLINMYHTKNFMIHPLSLLSKSYFNIPIKNLYKKNGDLFKDWLSSIHYLIELFITEIFLEAFDPNDIIVYSGGCAQNTVINNKLSSIFSDLIIPPHCYDGGLSLGCAFFVANFYNEEIYMDEFPFCNCLDDLGYASNNTIERVADLLAKGKIIGWAQGKSEIGPRALGHRSILVNPKIDGIKELLNDRIKKREYWRPYAASVLPDHLFKFTDKVGKYPYMLHAIETFPRMKAVYKSIIHFDNTCRFQTVGYDESLSTYRMLLNIMQEKYEVDALLNTSLNANGKPIALSFSDCFSYYSNTELDAICIGNQLFIKDN